jgi:hypothetical protein
VNQWFYSLAVFLFSFRKEFWDLTQYECGGHVALGILLSLVKKGLMFQLSHKIEKHGQGFLKGLTPLPGQDRWEGTLPSKSHNQPLLFRTYTFV